MILSIKKAAKLMLAAVCCGLGLEANAQVLTASNAITSQPVPEAVTPANYTCVPTGTTQLYLSYTVPAGATFASWKVEGDFTPVAGYPATPTTPATRIIPSGYGKIRVTVGYYIQNGTQPGTVNCLPYGPITCDIPKIEYVSKQYVFYKTFTNWTNTALTPNTIAGTTCVPAGSSVVYSIFPRVSESSLIAQNIGIDDYKWFVVTDLNASVPFTYAAGDNSAITFPAPARPFKVRLVVGNCNGSPQTTYTPAPTGAEKVLSVSTTAAVPTLASPPTCVLTSATTFGFTLNGLTVGASYSIQTTLGNVTTPTLAGGAFTATSATQAVSVTGANGNAGDVFIKPTVGCNATALQVPLTRTLSSVVNPTTGLAPTLTNPGCQAAVAAGVLPAAIVLTLNNAPGSASGYTWTLPFSTWTASGTGGNTVTQVGAIVTSTQPTISIQRPAGSNVGGTVRVDVAGCLAAANFVQRAINITGLPAGCSAANYTLARSYSGSTPIPDGFSVSATGGCPLPFGTNIYKWERLDTVPVITVYTSGPSVGFGHLAPFQQSDVRVTIDNPATCQYLVLSSVNLRPAPTGSTGTGSPLTAETKTAASLNRALNVYPNPANQTVQVELPGAGGTALTLYDALGRAIHQSELKEGRATVEVKSLPEGQYYLRVERAGVLLYRQVQVRH